MAGDASSGSSRTYTGAAHLLSGCRRYIRYHNKREGGMEAPRTCFVISPIGERDSEIRKHADNLIRRIILPSLSGLNFQTIRVDLSFANSRISDEIVTLIKNSELCIVDSAGYNPNVMYELGRRHQTSKKAASD